MPPSKPWVRIPFLDLNSGRHPAKNDLWVDTVIRIPLDYCSLISSVKLIYRTPRRHSGHQMCPTPHTPLPIGGRPPTSRASSSTTGSAPRSTMTRLAPPSLSQPPCGSRASTLNWVPSLSSPWGGVVWLWASGPLRGRGPLSLPCCGFGSLVYKPLL